MQFKTQHFVLILLAISAMLLTQFIPSNVITFQDSGFTDINSCIRFVFNIYLFLLGGSSFLLLPLIWLCNRFAFKATIFAAISYIIIYMLDLSHQLSYLSPSSLNAFWAEVIGLFLAVPLLMLSIDFVNEDQHKEQKVRKRVVILWQLFILIALVFLEYS